MNLFRLITGQVYQFEDNGRLCFPSQHSVNSHCSQLNKHFMEYNMGSSLLLFLEIPPDGFDFSLVIVYQC